MKWLVCFIIAILILLLAVIFSLIRGKTKYKKGRIIDASKILTVGVVVAAVVLFVPIYINNFNTDNFGPAETLLISVHNMIRLFVVDGDFDFIVDNLTGAPELLAKAYSILFAVLFVCAPILTFGFVLSFFKNLSAYRRCIMCYNTDMYIFSELNEKSLALAESLYKKYGKKCLIVFTDVYEKEEEQISEFIEYAKELNAVFFKKDIAAIDFSFHGSNSNLNFFAIGEDETENIVQAISIVNSLKSRDNTNLFVFSTQVEAEMLLTNAFKGSKEEAKIKVRRVNEVQSLILRNLYDEGYEKIFQTAVPDENGIRHINALILGLGRHGIEMTKALTWFCQMDGYQVDIQAFELDKKAQEKFISQCPELMKFNGRTDIEGDAAYTITIHPDTDVNTSEFDELIRSVPATTYAFVALGTDEKNIAAAVKLRMLFERRGCKPALQTIVYNSEKRNSLLGVTNFKGESYNIDFIGDMKTTYSEKAILGSDVEALALSRHVKWGNERDFWQYNYNYKSSVASAIHKKMKTLCGIPGIDKNKADRTEEELWSIRILEHKRWNAYMRSEGYIYGGSIEKKGRNDLGKMHNCLVPFNELPLSEQEKDDD